MISNLSYLNDFYRSLTYRGLDRFGGVLHQTYPLPFFIEDDLSGVIVFWG